MEESAWEAAQFRACSGQKQALGKTALEALAALMSDPEVDASLPITIWPFNRGDTFFRNDQQARLRDLSLRRQTLSPSERVELERLIEAAFDATVARTRSGRPQARRAER